MIRTVGELREALADFPDYYPICSEVPPLVVGTGYDHEPTDFRGYDDEPDYTDMPVPLAPVDIDENGMDFTHVELEGSPPVVVVHGTAEFSTVLIDPDWVRGLCDEAAAWAVNELRDQLLAAAARHPHSLSRPYVLRALNGDPR